MNIVKNKIWFIILGVAILLLAVILIVLNNAKNSYLNIYVTPTSAKISIDGTEYENGVFKLFPGSYVATVSADGFETREFTLTLSPEECANLFIGLAPNEQNKDFYTKQSSSDDLAILNQLAEYDNTAKIINSEINKKEAIYANLPKAFKSDTYYYSIEKRQDCENILCLTVRNFVGNNYEVAKQEINNLGFNPEDYQIVNVDGAGNIYEN